MSSGKCNLVFKIQSPSISWICTGATLVFSDFQLVTKSLVSLKKRPQHTPPLELFGLFQANLKLDHEATCSPIHVKMKEIWNVFFRKVFVIERQISMKSRVFSMKPKRSTGHDSNKIRKMPLLCTGLYLVFVGTRSLKKKSERCHCCALVDI